MVATTNATAPTPGMNGGFGFGFGNTAKAGNVTISIEEYRKLVAAKAHLDVIMAAQDSGSMDPADAIQAVRVCSCPACTSAESQE